MRNPIKEIIKYLTLNADALIDEKIKMLLISQRLERKNETFYSRLYDQDLDGYWG